MTSFAVFILLLVVCHQDATAEQLTRYFPKGFMFGASTAAYQIEGGWDEDGRGPSIWDTITHKDPSPIQDGSTGDIAADSYHQYKRDVEIIKELGLHFYRFSVSWSRILPDGFANKINLDGLAYYDALIDELLKNGIQPFLTIYHWDLPERLQQLGGWANPQIVTWFEDYAKVLFARFAGKVKFWVTINEPKQICYEGYGSDIKAPRLNISGIAEYMCAKNILLAHARAYKVYDEQYRKIHNGSVGISISCTWFEPATQSSKSDVNAARDARQFDWGTYAHPIFSHKGDFPLEVKRNILQKSAEQGFPRSRLPELTAEEIKLIRGSSDFFGMNTYSSKLAYRDASLEGMYPSPSYMDDMGSVLVKDPSWPQAQSAWLQEVPWGFYKLLKEISHLYNNPRIIVTENGWSTAGGLLDEDRISYYKNYMNAMLDAIREGVNVKGYTAWSLIDNFEWMHGYTEKFGLYEVDFSADERTRTPRKSAFFFKHVIETNSLDPSYEPENFTAIVDRTRFNNNDVI